MLKLKDIKNPNYFETAYDIYTTSKEMNYKPSIEIYNILINLCIPTMNVEKVEELFNLAIESNCEPNLQTYNLMIHFFANFIRNDKNFKVEYYYNLMRKNNIYPDYYTFHWLITNFSIGGYVRKCEYYFNQMENFNLIRSSIIYERIIKGCYIPADLTTVLFFFLIIYLLFIYLLFIYLFIS